MMHCSAELHRRPGLPAPGNPHNTPARTVLYLRNATLMVWYKLTHVSKNSNVAILGVETNSNSATRQHGVISQMETHFILTTVTTSYKFLTVSKGVEVLIMPSIIRIIMSRRMRWVGHVARMGEKRNVYRLLVGKPKGKRPLRRPRYRWMDNIKMDLSEIGMSVVDWIGLAQDRYRWRALVNAVMNLRVP
jgi:hypothetical protein